jgi:glycosyltransferase involved in cell wall biosynthesis
VRLPFQGQEKLKRIAWQQGVLSIQLRADGCDLLHSPTYVTPLLNNLYPRVPTILTIYDTIALDAPHYATALNRLHYRALMPRSIKQASRIVVPSDAAAAAVQRHVPQAIAKIRVVPLGLEPIFFEKPNESTLQEVRARYKLPERYVLYVGNFEPKKNLENVIKAMLLVPDAPPLVVAGGARAWRDLPNDWPVQKIGYVRRRDLPALYAGCEVFLFPSHYEGFGLPVLEALACGAPVITSRHVPLPGLEKVALFCEPDSPEDIAAALSSILDNRALQSQRSISGQEYSCAFTWRRAAEMTLQIYREAAGLL